MELVFNGFTNAVRLRVSSYSNGVREPVDFSAAASVNLVVNGQTVPASSKGSDGVLTFDSIGSAGIPAGEYPARLVADGQILAHESTGDLVVRVV